MNTAALSGRCHNSAIGAGGAWSTISTRTPALATTTPSRRRHREATCGRHGIHAGVGDHPNPFRASGGPQEPGPSDPVLWGDFTLEEAMTDISAPAAPWAHRLGERSRTGDRPACPGPRRGEEKRRRRADPGRDPVAQRRGAAARDAGLRERHPPRHRRRGHRPDRLQPMRRSGARLLPQFPRKVRAGAGLSGIQEGRPDGRSRECAQRPAGRRPQAHRQHHRESTQDPHARAARGIGGRHQIVHRPLPPPSGARGNRYLPDAATIS